MFLSLDRAVCSSFDLWMRYLCDLLWWNCPPFIVGRTDTDCSDGHVLHWANAIIVMKLPFCVVGGSWSFSCNTDHVTIPHCPATYVSKSSLGPTWNVHNSMSDLPNILVSSSVFLTPTLNTFMLHSLWVNFCAPLNNVSSRHSKPFFLGKGNDSKGRITGSTGSSLILLHHTRVGILILATLL